MTSSQSSSALWRKSSYSNGQANCVEVATVQGDRAGVAIRDSKAADGPCLIFTAGAWRRLTSDVEASVRP
jgi:hypothetical protein